MSTQCNRFVQNAWKKELCSNCFKPKEEHTATDEILRLNVEKASTNLKIDHLQLQGILRGKAICRKDQRKRNVGFPESLAEIIGYGGDDFFSDGEEDNDGAGNDSAANPEDEVPDSEEERALGNLTRANTSFNTVTANLTGLGSNGSNEAIKSPSSTTATKSFGSLMLGKIQRDADGRKTTLLVSVTPFGGDESVPTARRPVDRKNNAISSQASPLRCKPDDGSSSDNDAAKKLNGAERRKLDEQEQKYPAELEKIVDMPLITSTNMITVVRREGATTDTANGHAVERAAGTMQRCAQICKPDKRNAVLAGVSAVKKTETETSRIPARSAMLNANAGEDNRAKRIAATRSECPKRMEETTGGQEGIELTLTPLKNVGAPESDCSTNIATVGRNSDETNRTKEISLLRVREVDGECESAQERKFCFENSRELAGEPDGKADEEEVMEPPALPTSPPPIASTEPRSSFLHGGVAGESKAKPAVPQKPVTFSTKPSSTDSIAPLAARKIPNGDYVLPPPSVQNVAGRSAQNSGMQETDSRYSAKKDEISSETEQIFSAAMNRNPDSGDRTNAPSKSALALLSTSASLTTILATNPSTIHNNEDNSEMDENVAPDDEEFAELTPVSVSTMELVRSPNKRRMAPKPPAIESTEDLPVSSLFARNPGANLKSDSPVVREKEKRERSSSCSPKFRKAVCDLPDPTNPASPSNPTQPIEQTVPRRTISLSQDSLTTERETREEKKRGRNRRGFSLKRFLRMGSRKDMDMLTGARTDEIPSTPQPKPRLEIIHPLELDGAAVEVLGNERIANRIISEDQTDSCAVKSDGARTTRCPATSAARPGKPPPPPRNQSLEDWSRLDPANKPIRPPPPRADTKLSIVARSDKASAKSAWRPTAVATTSDSIYANLVPEIRKR